MYIKYEGNPIKTNENRANYRREVTEMVNERCDHVWSRLNCKDLLEGWLVPKVTLIKAVDMDGDEEDEGEDMHADAAQQKPTEIK